MVIVLGGLVGLVILAVAGIFIYLNYEKPKTEDQKKSLEVIRQLNQTPTPRPYTGKVSEDVPEIYDDRKLPKGFSTSEGDPDK